MVILKLHPLFIYICISMFKNDIFPCDAAQHKIEVTGPITLDLFLLPGLSLPGNDINNRHRWLDTNAC